MLFIKFWKLPRLALALPISLSKSPVILLKSKFDMSAWRLSSSPAIRFLTASILFSKSESSPRAEKSTPEIRLSKSPISVSRSPICADNSAKRLKSKPVTSSCNALISSVRPLIKSLSPPGPNAPSSTGRNPLKESFSASTCVPAPFRSSTSVFS